MKITTNIYKLANVFVNFCADVVISGSAY